MHPQEHQPGENRGNGVALWNDFWTTTALTIWDYISNSKFIRKVSIYGCVFQEEDILLSHLGLLNMSTTGKNWFHLGSFLNPRMRQRSCVF